MQNGVFTYLNAWTRSNDSLTSEYVLKYAYNSRVSVLHEYTNTTIHKCLSTRGMPWQDLQRWSYTNCSFKDVSLLLRYQNTIKSTTSVSKFL